MKKRMAALMMATMMDRLRHHGDTSAHLSEDGRE